MEALSHSVLLVFRSRGRGVLRSSAGAVLHRVRSIGHHVHAPLYVFAMRVIHKYSKKQGDVVALAVYSK